MRALFNNICQQLATDPTAVINTSPALQVPPPPQPLQYVTVNRLVSPPGCGLSAQQLQNIAPQLSVECCGIYSGAINHFMTIYGISQAMLPMFLAQALVESQAFTRLEENLYYTTADAVVRAWPQRFTVNSALAYLRNPAKLANHVYCNRYGNGDEASGDGYKYRGRGAFMYTFYDNYQELATHWQMPVEQAIDYIVTPDGAIASAMFFYRQHNLGRFTRAEQVDACTQIINGGTNGLADRQRLFNDAGVALG